MTTEERKEKEAICDIFLKKIEQQFNDFKQETGINFYSESSSGLYFMENEPLGIGKRLVHAFRKYKFHFAPYIDNTPTLDNKNDIYYIFTDKLDYSDNLDMVSESN